MSAKCFLLSAQGNSLCIAHICWTKEKNSICTKQSIGQTRSALTHARKHGSLENAEQNEKKKKTQRTDRANERNVPSGIFRP